MGQEKLSSACLYDEFPDTIKSSSIALCPPGCKRNPPPSQDGSEGASDPRDETEKAQVKTRMT